MPTTERPGSCALRTRKASAELPSSKTTEQVTKAAKPRPSPRRRRRGPPRRRPGPVHRPVPRRHCFARPASYAHRGHRPQGPLRPETRAPDSTGPGFGRSPLRGAPPPPCTCRTTQIDTAIPITAPAVSAARCSPKASPRRPADVESASRASRGAVRTPFPTRSPQRIMKLRAVGSVWPPPNQPRLPFEETAVNTAALIASGIVLVIGHRI